MAPPLAAPGATDQSTMEALAGGGGAPQGASSPDQVRARIEQAVTQIRDVSAQLDTISKGIPGSEKLMTQIKTQLRQVAQMAAQAGAQQNGSADALPG